MNARHAGYLAALGATALWAGNFVVARGIAHEIPPIQLNFWRWTLALACILPLALPRLRGDLPVIRRHWAYLAGMSLVGVSLLNALVYKAGQTTESINMALLVPTAPVMIVVLSRIVYGEPVTPRRFAGIGVVLLGVMVLVSRGDPGRIIDVAFTPGDLWALAGASCFAVYSLFVRKRPAALSVEGFNAVTFAMGVALMLPAVAWEMAVLPGPSWSPQVLGGIVYSAVGCSFMAYLLWTRAIAAIGPVLAGIVYYLLPLFTAIESVLLLGERVTAAHVLGGALIVSGILAATVDPRALGMAAGKGR